MSSSLITTFIKTIPMYEKQEGMGEQYQVEKKKG